MGDITDEFRGKMSEWVELKKQLTEARKDMKVLNQKEKELKEFIGSFMKEPQEGQSYQADYTEETISIAQGCRDGSYRLFPG